MPTKMADTFGELDLFLAAALSSYKTNHNKAPVRVLVSQPITAYAGHIQGAPKKVTP